VFNELRSRIIQGDIAPGERLKVESLKVLLNTGASPIREALSLLTSDQLVERIDQRGFRAAPASEAHFREILMLRCQLEDIALRASIKSGDSGWEEQAVLAHHRLSKVPRSDQQRWEVLHKDFHRSLLLACGSPILLRFCDQLYDLNIRYRFLAGKSGRYSQRDVVREHADILQAVLDRDAEDACERLNDHYRLTGEFLADNMQIARQ
jgi:DNA-binding GntR family transcriptional regulator